MDSYPQLRILYRPNGTQFAELDGVLYGEVLGHPHLVITEVKHVLDASHVDLLWTKWIKMQLIMRNVPGRTHGLLMLLRQSKTARKRSTTNPIAPNFTASLFPQSPPFSGFSKQQLIRAKVSM